MNENSLEKVQDFKMQQLEKCFNVLAAETQSTSFFFEFAKIKLVLVHFVLWKMCCFIQRRTK